MRRHATKRKGANALPPLWLVTDPDRTPDPAAVAALLPPGAGVIYRGFGRPEAPSQAAELADVALDNGLVLLIGQDAELAQRVGADGVHLPERLAHLAPRLRQRHPGWIITTAAHSALALCRAGRYGVDAALVSAVFPSNSPSAGRPLGVVRFTGLVRSALVPVYALGGIKAHNVTRLRSSGAIGVAAVEGIRTR